MRHEVKITKESISRIEESLSESREKSNNNNFLYSNLDDENREKVMLKDVKVSKSLIYYFE